MSLFLAYPVLHVVLRHKRETDPHQKIAHENIYKMRTAVSLSVFRGMLSFCLVCPDFVDVN